ncbi:MAG: hypothetical protein KAJ13_06100 [Gemmatimonadetes bacterium]|nr:hypothetical protein [Gemmatimonadota bacterium]
MKLFRKKMWRPIDIGLLKWSMILLGMVLGALLSDFVKQNIWVFIAVGLAMLIRPIFVYLRNDP